MPGIGLFFLSARNESDYGTDLKHLLLDFVCRGWRGHFCGSFSALKTSASRSMGKENSSWFALLGFCSFLLLAELSPLRLHRFVGIFDCGRAGTFVLVRAPVCVRNLGASRGGGRISTKQARTKGIKIRSPQRRREATVGGRLNRWGQLAFTISRLEGSLLFEQRFLARGPASLGRGLLLLLLLAQHCQHFVVLMHACRYVGIML